MNSRNIGRTDAGKRVQKLNKVTENATQLATIDDIDEVLEDIDNTLVTIDLAAKKESEDISGLRPNKVEKRTAMAKCVVKYSSRAWVKAHRAKATDLEKGLEHPETYYTVGPVDDGINRASATVKIIEENSTIITNVKPTEIIEMKTGISEFVKVKDDPITAMHEKTAEGNEVYDPMLDHLDDCIQQEGALIHSYFPDSTLAKNFDLESTVHVLGVRHNPVTVYLKHAERGTPITNGKVTKAGTNLSEKTNSEGAAPFESSKLGLQSFIAEAPGFVTQEVSAQINRASMTEIVVRMNPVDINVS